MSERVRVRSQRNSEESIELVGVFGSIDTIEDVV